MIGEKNNKKPLVSVCMPTRNGSAFIREAMDSVLAQTYDNLEIIVSDNASTDDTPDIIKEYLKKDKRIRYIRQERNIGHIKNYNFSHREAKGKYWMFAFDDDILDKSFVERCVERLERSPDSVMAFSDFVIFGEGTSFPSFPISKILPEERDLYKRLKKHILFYFNDGKGAPLYSLWDTEKTSDLALSPLFSFQYRNKMRTLYYGVEDNFIFRALTRGPAELVHEVLFRKRRRPGREKPMKLNIIFRFFRSLFWRIMIFFSPFFYYNIYYILSVKKLSFRKRMTLVFLQVWVMLRLFLDKKI